MAKRVRVTTRKHNGDDRYSWAVFKDGILVVGGCSKHEAASIRDDIRRKLGEK